MRVISLFSTVCAHSSLRVLGLSCIWNTLPLCENSWLQSHLDTRSHTQAHVDKHSHSSPGNQS